MSHTDSPSTAPGRPWSLDERYRLDELVGAGGMAEVWRARDDRLGRSVAVKLLSGPSARDPSMRKRIAREARALASLSHPNIVAVYDYGEAPTESGDVQPYLVMELVDGPDLHRYTEANGPLPVAEAKEILRSILAAVACAHSAGIVHGDLKPANVIMSTSGPKVGDFGVARILAEETGTTTVAATPTFAAPEVLRGDRPKEPSDIYSAACIGFQMLTGHPPYEGTNAWSVAVKHLEDPIPRVRDVRPDIPQGFDDVVARAMAKNPKRRFASADFFADAFADVPVTVPVEHPSATEPALPTGTEVLTGRPDLVAAALWGPLRGPLSRGYQHARRRARPIALAAALAIGALLLLSLLTSRGPDLATIPDVRGLQSAAAVARLRSSGFDTDVSYRPVNQGEANIVLETVPTVGERVAVGTQIHVISAAVPRTPEPVISNTNRGRGKDKNDGDEGD